MSDSTQGDRDQNSIGQTLREAEAEGISDLAMGAFGSRSATAGRTDFENHRLNEMLDLVDSAAPERLTDAGDALLRARTAINKAAGELDGHIERIDWEGESGEAFRKWGKRLVKNTRKLGDFAEQAGIQVTATGNGLASVRKSMPGRDERDDPKTVDDIPNSKQKEGNPEYDVAMKVEKDRQEAIAQMTRLSSYYLVAEENLAKEEGPTFGAMPSLGVPRPKSNDNPGSGVLDDNSPTESARNASFSKKIQPEGADAEPIAPVDKSVTAQQPANVEINSIEPLPTQAVEHSGSTSGSPTGKAPPTQTSIPAPTPINTPVANQRMTPRAPAGFPGGKMPGTGSMARPAVPGNQGPVLPRPITQNPANPTSGTGGRATGIGPPPVNGRPGVSGTTGSPVGRVSASGPYPRASHGGGIVGGMPRPTAPSANSGRLPRGQVIGEASNNPGQGTTGIRSQTDANNNDAARRRLTGWSGGTVGRTPTNGKGPNTSLQFTPGGTGLVRRGQEQYATTDGATKGDGSSIAPSSGDRKPRTDPFMQDETTRSRRGRSTAVPPVIE